MVNGIPNHVHQRIAELLHDELVDFRLGSGDDEPDFLVGIAADLAHHARQSVEDLRKRHHAHFEYYVLHLGEPTVEVETEPLQLGRELALSFAAQAIGKPQQ